MKTKHALLSGCALAASLLLASITSVQAAENNPSKMTCGEFVNLNPKAMAPVALWMLNDKTEYKGGDSVDLNMVETVAVPQTLEFCKKSPKANVYEFKNNLQSLIAH